MKKHTETYYSCDYCGCEGTKGTIEYHESYCSCNPAVLSKFQSYVGKCYTNGLYSYHFSKLSENGMDVAVAYFNRTMDTFTVRKEIWDLEDVEDHAEDYDEIPATEYLATIGRAFDTIRGW